MGEGHQDNPPLPLPAPDMQNTESMPKDEAILAYENEIRCVHFL